MVQFSTIGKPKKKGRKKVRRDLSRRSHQTVKVENMKRKRIDKRIIKNVNADLEGSDVTLKLRKLSIELKSQNEKITRLRSMFEELAIPYEEMKRICLGNNPAKTNHEFIASDSYSYLRWLIKKGNCSQSAP